MDASGAESADVPRKQEQCHPEHMAGGCTFSDTSELSRIVVLRIKNASISRRKNLASKWGKKSSPQIQKERVFRTSG